MSIILPTFAGLIEGAILTWAIAKVRNRLFCFRTLGMYEREYKYADNSKSYTIIVIFKTDQWDRRSAIVVGCDSNGEQNNVRKWFLTTEPYLVVIQPWLEGTTTFVEMSEQLNRYS